MWLFSTYQVSLPKPVLVRSEAGDAVVLQANLKGWDAEVALTPNTRLGRIRPPGAGGWFYPVSQFEITVARDGELGDEMVHEEAARSMAERLLVFLHYRQKYSLFDAIEKYQQYYADPAVCDDIVTVTPTLNLAAGYEQRNMHDYVCELFSHKLCQGLLRDAAVSIEHSRSRRACLELSMACEAALGMRLESAGLVKAGIGSLFMNRHSEAVEAIVQLFQARDAMRQRGDGLFKFISAAQRQEINHNLTAWRGAVECLVDSLNALNRSLQEA